MILVDVNLLLYAAVESFSQHQSARAWLDRELAGLGRVGMPWHSLLGFLRLSTNPRIFERPLSTELAWKQIEEWLDQESVWIPTPTPRHRRVFAELVLATGARGDLIPDAHLATLAMEHGLTLCSTDSDFAAFSGLRWVNPLAPRPAR